MMKSFNDAYRFRNILRQIPYNAVVIVLIVTIFLVVIYGMFWAFGDTQIVPANTSYYLLRDLVKDSSETALQVGALFVGILGIYKYWYSRYEPLIYFVACGLIRISLVSDLVRHNKSFQRIWGSKEPPHEDSDVDMQKLHDLPIVVLHKSCMEQLCLREGAKVDLLFQTPDDKAIWAIAFAFSYESTNQVRYRDWPIGLTLSMRRYFRIERPCSVGFGKRRVPEGWFTVKANTKDLADLHASTRQDNALIWMVSDEYSVRFRDPDVPCKFHTEDSFDDDGRIMEYVGISLRVMRRGLFRYRAAYE